MQINRLSDRGIHPTSQTVKNLAEENKGGSVGKNRVSTFLKHHNMKLKSLYLRNMENLRFSAEYAPMFKLFFALVSIILCFLRCIYLSVKASISIFN